MNPADIRICFVGDSYVHGTGDDLCLGWAGRLCARAREVGHNVTAYNLGVRRETSADIARRWRAECVPRLLPTSENYVVFSFGANDAVLEKGVPRVPLDETLANLEIILDASKAHYHTLVIGPPAVPDQEMNSRLATLSTRMGEVATSKGVPYFALFPLLINETTWMEEVRGYDGAHPRAAGYARVAGLIGTFPGWWFKSR